MRILTRAAAAMVLAASVAACSDSLGPEDVNPADLSSKLGSAATTFENNVAFQSLLQLSSLFPTYTAIQAVRATLPAGVEAGSWSGAASARATAARAALAAASSPEGARVDFPFDLLGKTLEWDEATDQYVVGTRTGAPANGIRILLYAVNPITGMPVEPAQELGSLDLTDEDVPQFQRLGVVLRLATTVVADYDITVTTGTSSGSIVAEGYLQKPDGSGRLSFRISVSTTFSTTEIVVDIDATDGTAVFVQLIFGQASTSLTFRVAHGGNSIEIGADLTDTAIEGEIRYNGSVVATLTGDPDDPTIVGANGHTVTPQELAALEAIFSRAGDFLEDFIDGIFGPGNVVFGGTL